MKNPTARTGRAISLTLKARIWAVIVVPILAPRMTATLCEVDIRPAEIKPTSSTVVMDEDWMIAVIVAPVATPMKRLRVTRASNDLM